MAIIVNITADSVEDLRKDLTDLLYGLKDPDQSRLLDALSGAAADEDADAEEDKPEAEAAPRQRRGRGRPRKNPAPEVAASEDTPPPPPAPELPVVEEGPVLADAPSEVKPNGSDGENFDDAFDLPTPSVKQDYDTAINLLRDLYHNGSGPAVRDVLVSYKVKKAHEIPENEGTTLLALAKSIEAKLAAKSA